MIFDASHIPFILAGRTTTAIIPVVGDHCHYTKGRTYSVNPRTPRIEDDDGNIIRPARIKPAIARILITDIQRVEDTWHLTFQLDRSDPPRLMHQHSEKGYTTRRHEALDPDADAVEPDILERYAKANRERHQQFKKTAQPSLTERLDRIQALADAHGVDVDRGLRQIHRHVAALERRINRAA